MEKGVVKLGVVGLYRGRDVVSGIVGDKNVQLRAICDKRPDRLKEAEHFFKKEKRVKNLLVFERYEDLLQSDVDAVVVATDVPLHVDHVLQALEAGKHVISEIPAVYTIEEGKRLRQAVKAHPELKYMVAENCCYWAFVQAWKRMHEEGKFGDIVYAEGEYLHASPPENICKERYPDDYWRTHLNAICYLTHELGPLLYIMDDRVVSVTCMEPEVKYNPYKKGAQTGVALFRTAKGAVIRILICFGAYVNSDHNYCLLGTRGTIETDKTKSLVEAHSFARLQEVPDSYSKKLEIPVTLHFAGESDEGHGGADVKMMRDFIRCIIEDTEPPIGVDEGLRMSLPGIYAHQSAVQGGALVEIPDLEE